MSYLNSPTAPQAPYLSASNSVTLLNVSNLLNQKDSRWLQLEVCREFQRNKCSRSDSECKFAHPKNNVEVQNGRVTACYDSIKVSSEFTGSRDPRSRDLFRFFILRVSI